LNDRCVRPARLSSGKQKAAALIGRSRGAPPGQRRCLSARRWTLQAVSDHGHARESLFKLRARAADLGILVFYQTLEGNDGAVSETLTIAILMLRAASAAGFLCSAKNRQVLLTK